VRAKVWEYVDPSLTADKALNLIEPKIPKPSGIKEGAVSPIDLTSNELEEFQQLQSAVKPEVKEFELKEKALTEMVKHIQETVSSTYVSWMYDCDTVYEMLAALQKRLKPRKDVRRRELTNKPIKLRDYPENHQIDEWLQGYEIPFVAPVSTPSPAELSNPALPVLGSSTP
jgi:hypothetical protein